MATASVKNNDANGTTLSAAFADPTKVVFSYDGSDLTNIANPTLPSTKKQYAIAGFDCVKTTVGTANNYFVRNVTIIVYTNDGGHVYEVVPVNTTFTNVIGE